jgi:hypothetical protein
MGLWLAGPVGRHSPERSISSAKEQHAPSEIGGIATRVKFFHTHTGCTGNRPFQGIIAIIQGKAPENSPVDVIALGSGSKLGPDPHRFWPLRWVLSRSRLLDSVRTHPHDLSSCTRRYRNTVASSSLASLIAAPVTMGFSENSVISGGSCERPVATPMRSAEPRRNFHYNVDMVQS